MKATVSTLPALTMPDSAADRGRQRNRRALLASVVNLAARFVGVATSFATVPLTLYYLGSERFGLWMTISSLTALFAFADMGLGNGLLNAVSQSNGRNDVPSMRRQIASAAAMLAGIALLLLALLVPVLMVADLGSVFGLTDPSALRELRPALLVFVTLFALNVAVGFVPRVQLGLQMGFINGVVSAAGALLGLLGVLLAVQLAAGLPWLVGALLGGPLLATLAGGVWLFDRQRPDLRPRRADVQRATMNSLARLGALFFVLQAAAAVAYASDNLIGARFAGAVAVGEFAIAAKLFSVVGVLVPIFLGPLWPAYGEAIARGDTAWVRTTLRRSTLLALGSATLLSLVLLFGFGPLTQLWLQRQPEASASLLAGLALWVVLSAVGGALSMFLNGAHVVWEQTVIAVVFAAACITAKVFAVQRWGLQALPWAACATYALLVLVPYFLLLPGLLRRVAPPPTPGPKA